MSEILKSKHEEGEAYISEIEVRISLLKMYRLFSNENIYWDEHLTYLLQSIGQAYEDMQTQNQHLLQQIIERDDYNIKVIST